jgi:hypothetical protein
MVIAFIVEDIDATYAELKAKGVEFLNGIGEEDRGQYAPFRDPDGNRLQRYQPHLGSLIINSHKSPQHKDESHVIFTL